MPKPYCRFVLAAPVRVSRIGIWCSFKLTFNFKFGLVRETRTMTAVYEARTLPRFVSHESECFGYFKSFLISCKLFWFVRHATGLRTMAAEINFHGKPKEDYLKIQIHLFLFHKTLQKNNDILNHPSLIAIFRLQD